MALRVLIVPDKFKGTLPARDVAQAVAKGWKKSRTGDKIRLLPMSDGGEGFGEVIGSLLGAKPQKVKTVNAAREPITATWWWEPKSKLAVIESAKVIGLAMLPRGKFHPYQLDTFGLGRVLQAAAEKGATKCLIGIGGSATNDAGFGLARALGWAFTDRFGDEIQNWNDIRLLFGIHPPARRKLFSELIVAVDVKNPLHGSRGCSIVYGPQKGLSPTETRDANRKLKRMARMARENLHLDFAKVPGAGAAGGLGYGLMTYLGAKPKSGFDIFGKHSNLQKEIRAADVVITGEGALDRQTFMGKGVGQVAALCGKLKVPCLGIAGIVTDRERGRTLFREMRGLVELTSPANAMRDPVRYLEELTMEMASRWHYTG